MIRIAAVSALAISLSLSACSGGEDADYAEETSTVAGSDVTDLNDANTTADAISMAVDREKGDFADLRLGGLIEGPRGERLKVAFSNQVSAFADVTSYVACPDGIDPCEPTTAPEGTVYTYVFIVYPGEDMDPATGSGTGNDSSDIERATEFRMLRAANGFTGKAGYAKAEALAAIGPKADVVMSCDDGALVWTINAGDGGNQWEQGEPLTFWWQSTLPPAGPARAYQFEADATAATGEGPYPAAKAGVTNACLMEK
ncbi:hypothetical protein LY632_09080 [Erythrobacter sp. SDW2]|uniref:hypothetical protein n=1 Tax=Erythrobacter sp. SDW2 TaxID=2907154 RepID=UPI001F391589|nr:hypothetical protein [Erythrobacter sp. SDW2]UIP05860.1 hypothetical protein LY632_09080 [Erythrobacter sp. SDW2]